MPIPPPPQKKLYKPHIILILLIVFLVSITVLIFAGLRASALFRQGYQQRQIEQAKPPELAVKREVKRILLKKMLEDGSIQYIEILPSGLVNIYDANMNLIKSDLSSYYKVRALFNKINTNLDSFTSDANGNYTLTIDTNQGQFVLVFDDTINDLIHDVIDDIIEDIDEVVEEAFAPTPTLAPTITPNPSQPSITPIPFATPSPSGPSATPAPNATPTPLPGYMTAPPFKCEDYKYLNRPINISNIICGID